MVVGGGVFLGGLRTVIKIAGIAKKRFRTMTMNKNPVLPKEFFQLSKNIKI